MKYTPFIPQKLNASLYLKYKIQTLFLNLIVMKV